MLTLVFVKRAVHTTQGLNSDHSCLCKESSPYKPGTKQWSLLSLEEIPQTYEKQRHPFLTKGRSWRLSFCINANTWLVLARYRFKILRFIRSTAEILLLIQGIVLNDSVADDCPKWTDMKQSAQLLIIVRGPIRERDIQVARGKEYMGKGVQTWERPFRTWKKVRSF